MDKLKILLVPDFLPWILGTWAKQISQLGSLHDYYFFSQQMLQLYPDEWERLLSTVDVVHFLNQWNNKSIQIPPELPLITSVHHIVNEKEWSEQLLPPDKADAVVTVAKEWQTYLIEKGVPENTIHLFYNGVDTQKFYPYQNKSLARKILKINSNSLLIGYSAKLTSNYEGRKGTDIFLETLQLLAKSGWKFGIVITGPGWDKEVQRIESYGIEVFYRPFLPDQLMPAFYNALDMYVCTSRVEGGPVPVLESMACGTPVISTPVGVIKDYFEDSRNVLIVPKNDVRSTAQAVERLFKSSELRSKLANAALTIVQERLKWSNTMSGIEELYTQVWQAKQDRRILNSKSSRIDPEQQRRWAVSVDAYLWSNQLYQQGYFTEGLAGMLKNTLGSKGKYRLQLAQATISTVTRKNIRQLYRG